MSMHSTTDDTASAHGANHNFLAHLSASIQEQFSNAQNYAQGSLEALHNVGDRLNEAKETLSGPGNPKGSFGTWCDEQGFTFDRSWRARIMKLATHWAEIEVLIGLHPGNKRTWTLDGALALLAEAHKAPKAASIGDGSAEGEEGSTGSAEAPKETKAQKMERQLRELLERIVALETENAALRAGNGATKDKPKAPHGTVDAATKARAAKIWGLYTRGATEGEQNAAKARLMALAEKAGLAYADFVTACGLAQ